MRVCGFVSGSLLPPEPLDVAPETTSLYDLHALITSITAERLCDSNVVVDLYTINDEEGSSALLPPLRDHTLSSAGLNQSSIIYADIHRHGRPNRPVVERCEPSFGPEAGGTRVKLHGSGFLQSMGFASPEFRLGFGPSVVPATRLSDGILLCVAPPHAAGPVQVRLLCGREDDAGGASEGSAALFEYVKQEANHEFTHNPPPIPSLILAVHV